jgi:hypothetical protein
VRLVLPQILLVGQESRASAIPHDYFFHRARAKG